MSRLANAIVAAVLLLILIMGAYLQMGLPSADNDQASVFSKNDSGRNAAFELLSRLDFEVKAWTQAPGELPSSPSMLVVSEVPEAPVHYEVVNQAEEPAELDQVSLKFDRLYDPAHYRSFVEQGGTLVLSAGTKNWRFLDEYFGLDFGVEGLSEEVEEPEAGFIDEAIKSFEESLELEDPEEWSQEELTDPEHAEQWERGHKPFVVELWADAKPEAREELSLSWNAAVGLAQHPRLKPLVVAADDSLVAASLDIGAGSLVLLDGDQFFDNEWIGEQQNGLFAVRLAERFALDRAILFDEYSLGGWIPDSPLDLAFASDTRPLTLHLILALSLVLWGAAWVRWFPRDPAPLSAVSARMRARGMAGMLMRRRRWELLGQMLRLGVLRRLGRRSGMGRELLVAEDEQLQSPELLNSILAPVLREHGQVSRKRALQLLAPGDLRTRAELDRLARDLALLELDTLKQAKQKQT